MAIAYVNGDVNSSNNGQNVTLTFSGLQENDLVIVAYMIGDNDNNDYNMATSSTGWTEVVDIHAEDTYDTDLGVYWKVMGATPDTSMTVTGLGGTDSVTVAVWMAFRGVNPTSPLDVATTTATGVDTFVANPPSIDYTTSGCAVVAIGASANTVASGAFTAPTNYTTNFKTTSNTDTTNGTIGMGYRLSPADPEDPGTFSHNGTDLNTFSWCAATLALKPQAQINISHTAASFTTSGGTHTLRWDRKPQHTASALSASGASHNLAKLRSHTAAGLSLVGATHTALKSKNITHVAASITLSGAAHVLSKTRAHTAAGIALTAGTHTVLRSKTVGLTAASLTSAGGTHTLRWDRRPQHTASPIAASGATHTLRRGKPHTAASVVTSGATHALRRDRRHTASVLSVTGGTHTAGKGGGGVPKSVLHAAGTIRVVWPGYDQGWGNGSWGSDPWGWPLGTTVFHGYETSWIEADGYMVDVEGDASVLALEGAGD